MDLSLSGPFRHRILLSCICSPYVKAIYGEQIPENQPLYLTAWIKQVINQREALCYVFQSLYQPKYPDEWHPVRKKKYRPLLSKYIAVKQEIQYSPAVKAAAFWCNSRSERTVTWPSVFSWIMIHLVKTFIKNASAFLPCSTGAKHLPLCTAAIRRRL